MDDVRVALFTRTKPPQRAVRAQHVERITVAGLAVLLDNAAARLRGRGTLDRHDGSGADHPLWVPLVVAALGVVGVVVGVVITQWQANRRETRNWDRERERERERWAREDAARAFEQRREAYTDFYESLRELARTAYDHGMGLSDSEEQRHEAKHGNDDDEFYALQEVHDTDVQVLLEAMRKDLAIAEE